ncbi:MAG: hypothetical protein FWD57_11330, partial [Polyangiaceae bacterium]|nr:hypothetical protein [Polyangiaceae bacterium]
KDVVLAGSGEPTSIPNIYDALMTVQQCCRLHRPQLTLKLFTNGRQLCHRNVRESVGQFVENGGQVWVKLDGASVDTIGAVNGRVFDVESHLDALWGFAADHKIGLQTLLLHGPGLPKPELVVDEISAAVSNALKHGAQVSEMHLLTLSRRPSDPRMSEVLAPASLTDLEALAEIVRRNTSLPVAVFPA